MTNSPKFKFWDGKTMSHPMTLDDLAYEGFPSQFVDDHGDSVKGAVALQFTGLKDKNGTEIYAGDIFKATDSNLYDEVNGFVCEYDEHNVCYLARLIAYYDEPDRCLPEESEDSIYIGMEWLDNFEVIGNVYENEELINA